MSFSTPPPPPPEEPNHLVPPMMNPYDPEPEPEPQRSKAPLVITLAIAAILVLGGGGYFAANYLGLWGLGGNPQAAAESSTPTAAPPSENLASPEGGTNSVQPSMEPTPSSSVEASLGQSQNPQDGSPSPSEEASELSQDMAPPALSNRYCEVGDLVVLAETAKHTISICTQDGAWLYRGEGNSSGSVISLGATWESDGSYRAVNPGSPDTVYTLSPSRLTVTSGSTVLLDDSLLSYNTYGY